MSVVAVPYHLDEYLPDLELPLHPEDAGVVVAVELPAGAPWERLAVLYEQVAESVAARVSEGEVTVLSGDCAVSLGTMAGLQRAGLSPGIVWLDAHGDVQTPETTSSGYLAGMPLRLLAGYRPELIAGVLGLKPVPEQRIVLAGARDLDPPEEAYLAASLITTCEVAALAGARLPGGPLYVHVDADVIDPADLPGVRFPAPGGPPLAAVADAIAMLRATGRVAAIGFACSWLPGDGESAALLESVIDRLLTGSDIFLLHSEVSGRARELVSGAWTLMRRHSPSSIQVPVTTACAWYWRPSGTGRPLRTWWPRPSRGRGRPGARSVCIPRPARG
jgi:arginase